MGGSNAQAIPVTVLTFGSKEKKVRPINSRDGSSLSAGGGVIAAAIQATICRSYDSHYSHLHILVCTSFRSAQLRSTSYRRTRWSCIGGWWVGGEGGGIASYRQSGTPAGPVRTCGP